MSVLQGIVPPIVTPMQPDGQVDYDSLDRLLDHLLNAGVDGIFAMGSSGQVAYLTDAERDEVIRRSVARVAGRVPVVAGVADFTARRVIEQARRAADAGVAAVVVTAPLYALNDTAEIADHFRMVAAAVDVPVIAYDVPVRVKTKLSNDLVMQLAAEGTIVAVKDSSGDDVGFRRLAAANRAAGHPIDLLSGHEVMCDAMGMAGADGLVPGLGNVDPAGYLRLWQAVQAADWTTALVEQNRLNKLMEIAFVPQGRSGDAGGIGGFKMALELLGVIDSATMPAPIAPLSDADRDAIRAILAEVDLLS
ncbi:MAG: dihydrodipicolinate synthase family protein [Brooklawnia sp.]|nr:dihydrodipicolinate synthase family protein [Brooklawnia sp.]